MKVNSLMLSCFSTGLFNQHLKSDEPWFRKFDAVLFSNETTCPLSEFQTSYDSPPETLTEKKHGQDSHDFGLLKLPVFSFIVFSSMMTCTHNQPTCFSWLSNHKTFFFWRRNTSANWSEQLSVSVLWTTMDWPPVSNSPTLNPKKRYTSMVREKYVGKTRA